MRVKVEEIQEPGLTLNEALPADVLQEALGSLEGARVVEASKLKASFQRLQSGVLLRCELDCTVELPCRRCLRPVAQAVPVRFALNMVPQAAFDADAAQAEDDDGGERAGTFAFDEADHEPFDGKVIEVDPLVREQLALALPAAVLCREDCKGLCMVCGQDLNEKECGCERKMADPRFAKLKDLKL